MKQVYIVEGIADWKNSEIVNNFLSYWLLLKINPLLKMREVPIAFCWQVSVISVYRLEAIL